MFFGMTIDTEKFSKGIYFHFISKKQQILILFNKGQTTAKTILQTLTNTKKTFS
jgi:hypothetical protein